MSLCKPPQLTPELLAAKRQSARLFTGLRTLGGKQNSELNALKHGGYAALENHHETMLGRGERLLGEEIASRREESQFVEKVSMGNVNKILGSDIPSGTRTTEGASCAVALMARTLLRRPDFSSCQQCLRVLRAQKRLNTEVTENLRALRVKALEARNEAGMSMKRRG